MVKAFFSHSSIDKQDVRKIKSKLQRIWTYFDEDCFDAGEDFRNAIVNHINDTTLFVFFVSEASLKSSWVQFELDEAYWQTVHKRNFQVLVLALEDISVSQLPKWMQKSKFEIVKNHQLAAQMIKNMLFGDISIKKQIYIGREDDIKKFYDDINSYEADFPNIISVVGLNGIGRRTFIKDILSKRFSLDYTVEFYINEAEGLIELYRKLLDDNIEGNSKEDVEKLHKWFLSATIDEKAKEIARVFALYTESQSCPVLIDENAMLSEEGFYKEEFLKIMHYFKMNHFDHYLVILHTRLPKLGSEDKQLLYLFRLYALKKESCYSLFHSLLRRNNVPVYNYSQVKEISEYLEGYPPAIINATRECKMEGIDIVCNDKSSLIDFQSHLFSNYLKKIPLTELEEEILTVIHNIGNMPIIVLQTIIQKETEEIAVSLRKCHDYNIVEQCSTGLYTISPPMRMAVERKFYSYSKKEYSDISNRLIKEFWQPEEYIDFEIINIIINTVLRSGQEKKLLKFKDFVLPSHLLRAAEKANQDREWALAEKYARKTLELDEKQNKARNLLFRVLVRQESSKILMDAEKEENEILDILQKSHDIISYYYLEGFRYWKRGKFYDAIKQFELSIEAGNNSIEVHRDLAECYYQTGQISKAQNEIENVMGSRKISNPFILDLASKIAISLGNLELAEEWLSKQELVDRYENVAHRRATYEMKAENYLEALKYSDTACGGDRVLPEMRLLRMNIAIHLKKYDIVRTEYDTIKKEYKHYNSDICEALYTTMLLAERGWKEAEAGFEKISKKTSPFALNLKKKILISKLNDPVLSPILRERAETEKQNIEGRKMFDILEQFQCYDLRKNGVL